MKRWIYVPQLAILLSGIASLILAGKIHHDIEDWKQAENLPRNRGEIYMHPGCLRWTDNCQKYFAYSTEYPFAWTSLTRLPGAS